MSNPRQTTLYLYRYWDTIVSLVKLSQDSSLLDAEKVLFNIKKISSLEKKEEDRDENQILSSLEHEDILQTQPRSNDLKINDNVLKYVQGLIKEPEYDSPNILSVRIKDIDIARDRLMDAISAVPINMDGVLSATEQISKYVFETKKHIERNTLALENDIDKAKSISGDIPISMRYNKANEAYDLYIEPINKIVDISSDGIFSSSLEKAKNALEFVDNKLSSQGGILFTHTKQVRNTIYQINELQVFSKDMAKKCSDLWSPIKENIRKNNELSQAISYLLGEVRRKGLNRTYARSVKNKKLPVWNKTQKFKLTIGNKARQIMADMMNYKPIRAMFPKENDIVVKMPEIVNKDAIYAHLIKCLPVDDLLKWVNDNYGQYRDIIILRIFCNITYRPNLHIEIAEDKQLKIVLHNTTVTYSPYMTRLK